MMVVRRVGCEERAWTSALCEQRQPSCPSGSMLATSGRVDDLRGVGLGQHTNQSSALKPPEHFTWDMLHGQQLTLGRAGWQQLLRTPAWAEEGESPGQRQGRQTQLSLHHGKVTAEGNSATPAPYPVTPQSLWPHYWLPLRCGTSENTHRTLK